MTTTIYGIKNCDTMKKAFKWLDENDVEYIFYDYKKEGVNEDVLQEAIKQFGWQEVINRRGTTWRKLSDESKSSMNNEAAIEIAKQNPSIIKRPLLIHNDELILAFKEEIYIKIFQ